MNTLTVVGGSGQAIIRLAQPRDLKVFIARVLVWFLRRVRLSGLVRTQAGMLMHCDTKENLQMYVGAFGAYEPAVSCLVESRLAEGDVFVDVGANVGFHTLLASRKVGGAGACVAVESHPRTFAALQRNLALNGAAGNIRGVNAAVSDQPGELWVVNGPQNDCGLASVSTVKPLGSTLSVPSMPLDALLKPAEAARARLVKIDVEGFELNVVRGMRQLLAKGRADLEVIIEIAPQRMAGQFQDAEEIFAIFAAHGFSAWQIANHYELAEYVTPANEFKLTALGAAPRQQADVLFSRQPRGTAAV